MFHSLLKINAGGDPNRPRPGRTWLKNPYHVHQRLCMAFGAFQKVEDVASKQRVARSAETENFLYRVEGGLASGESGAILPPRIIVVSTVRPDWCKAFKQAVYLLDEWPDDPREFTPTFEAGQRLQFKLRANPTKKAKVCKATEQPFNLGKKKLDGKRVFIRDSKGQADWLKRKGDAAGFAVDYTSAKFSITDEGWHGARKTHPVDKPELPLRKDGSKRDTHLQFHSVLFTGELMVADPVKMAAALSSGIGSGKAFGFGLLSVARV